MPHRFEEHGRERVDSYYWLRERDNPEVIAYLEAENAHTAEMLKPVEKLQQKLFEEIVSRIEPNEDSVPYRVDDFYYYRRFVEGGEYPIYCRKKGSLESDEQILLDGNELARGHEFFSVRVQPSPRHGLLAYAIDTVGRRFYGLRFKDLATGETLPDRIERVTGNVAWANDDRTVFYTRQVPISLVYRKDLRRSEPSPLLLYAYGSYGYSTDPEFDAPLLSLLDRGFVYAIAHVRGGQELGRDWYESGKLLRKKNTFFDFIDCAEFLIEEGYTSRERLFASGGSAGGLLMGAVVNLRPDLFKGVAAGVPFVDVITTMLDPSVPLTTGEYDEWGDPRDERFYDYMLSYSPYDNVEPKAYPNLLVTTAFHDSQVQYWEPAKWVAKLRATKTDSNRLLLHTNMEAGHSGPSGRFQRHRDTALLYTFFLDLAGLGTH